MTCVVGPMTGEGLYTGRIPFKPAGTGTGLGQFKTTITNVNLFAFIGSVFIAEYAGWPGVTMNFNALLPGQSRTAYGPSFSYNGSTTSIPFRLDLSATSGSFGLAYRVCV